MSHGGYSGYGGYRASSQSTQSSLLQTVIRNLVDSVDEDERVGQRTRLENDLTVASERLDKLVQDHRPKLHGTLETFEKIDSRIQESQDKLRALKVSLGSSKRLLRCKRDELKRLWLDGVKCKNMLKMIDSIEEVRGVPEQLRSLKQSKHYLRATELLVNNVARLEGELAMVEGLKDLRAELKAEKERFHEELIDELHRHLYIKASVRQSDSHRARSPSDGVPGSVSASFAQQASPGPIKRIGSLPVGRHSRSQSRSMAMEKEAHPFVQLQPAIKEDEDVVDSLTVDPEERSEHFMALLIESLSVLGKVNEAVESIHNRMEKEFLLIIERSSVQVTRQAEKEAGLLGRRGGRDNQPRLLLKLLQNCFERFRNVVSAHAVLLGHLRRAKRVYKGSYDLYEAADVWAAIQHVVQSVLEFYLAVDVESSPTGHTSFNAYAMPGNSEVQAMFSRKKAKAAKKSVFKFDSSRHALSVSSYMREQRDIELAQGDEGAEPVAPSSRHYADDQPSISQHPVCKPSARNITVIFGCVREFVLEIEETIRRNPEESHCRLYSFIHDFVEDQFLENVAHDCQERVGNCTKPEAAKSIASEHKSAKVVGSKATVLNSVIVVWQQVEELRGLTRDLPMYSGSFLEIMCKLLQGFRDTCFSMYRELTTVVVEGARGADKAAVQEVVVSSRWAKDDDINRMIRSLPNWVKLRQGAGKGRPWEEEARQVYVKESETLTANLGAEHLRSSSVIVNHKHLQLLGILHESLDWFNGCLKQMVMSLTHSGASGPVSPTLLVTDMGAAMSSSRETAEEDPFLHERHTLDLMEQLSKIQFDFQSLLETVIIMLHLEVRCHCFYFLMPALQRSHYVSDTEGVEAEPQVRQLASDLKDIETVTAAVLSHEKYRYLFEGLGHLLASIFISSTRYVQRVNSNGIKKMYRNISVLQTCLTKITLVREKDLDRAQHYFELFELSEEEIFHQLGEQERLFTMKDYTTALKLKATSQPNFDQSRHEEIMRRLDQIFSSDTV